MVELVHDLPMVTPNGVPRNTQPPTQLPAPLGEGAAERGANAVSAMEDRGRIPGSSDFGMLLRRYRLAGGLSQEALAERARMSTNGISSLERGYRRTPQRETLALLVGALALNDEQREEFEAAAARSALLGRGASVTVGPWADGAPATLPLALISFVGRETELDEIAALVRVHRLITITGAGGIGKTQTALHVATALTEAGDIPVGFIGLAPIASPSLVVPAIASALGVQDVPNRLLLDTVLAYLKKKSLLLILDNCEHVIKESATVAAALLAGCPSVRILATSREPLRAAGEHAYRLPSLSVPSPEASHRLGATGAAEYGAIVLFSDRARAVDHRFMLTDENAPIVANICRRLDGVPLAIELAAARVNMLTLKQLRERLDERFRILTGGERTALPRQQTMRAAIDWSYNLLDEPERAFFRRLGIFVNGFALEGAVAVWSGDDLDELDVFDVLSSLIDKSLVLAEPQGDAMRYRLLESTRAYSLEKLAGAGERDFAAGRHLRYLRDRFAELWEKRDRTTQGSDLFAALQTELEDVRSALDGALFRSEVIDGGKLLTNISSSFQAIGLEAEGMARCVAYLAALPAGESRLRARLSNALSFLLKESGHKIRAFEVATQAVEHARASSDASVLISALQGYASSAINLHRFDDAERALVQAEAIPGISAGLRIQLLLTRASLSKNRGDRETAARMYEQLRKEQRSLGNIRGEQISGLNLAEVEHARGQTQRAIAIILEMLPAVRRGADKGTLTIILENLAGYLTAVDDLPGAVAAAREAIGIRAAREPDHVEVAIAIEHLALVVALRRDLLRAAMLEGYADAALGRHGYERESTETTTHDRLTALLHPGLAPDELARLSAQGAALAPEAAIALALEEHESK
jgi:predicted ATPase/transcriptional regulator with XRE-family HTH domain